MIGVGPRSYSENTASDIECLSSKGKEMHHIRRGSGNGEPLLLIHGLGGSWRSWPPILDGLASEREVIAVDLPGFGETPPLVREVSIATVSDAVTAFLHAQDLRGVDVAGSSMGARLVLELTRRSVVGTTVSLDPSGFWQGWEKTFFFASIRLIRLLQPVMPLITGNVVGRTLLFAQFSAHPWKLSPEVTLNEMRTFGIAFLRAPSPRPGVWRRAGRHIAGDDASSDRSDRDWVGTTGSRLHSTTSETCGKAFSRRQIPLVRSLWTFSAVGCP